MTDPLLQIQQLVALATHADTGIEEARTAALQACRLCAKHRVRITLEPEAIPTQAPPVTEHRAPARQTRKAERSLGERLAKDVARTVEREMRSVSLGDVLVWVKGKRP